MFWTESRQSSALPVVVSFLEVLESQEREKSKLGGGLGGERGKTSLWESCVQPNVKVALLNWGCCTNNESNYSVILKSKI